MTTISSASSSASSRYWVVSSSVVPPAASDRMISHIPSLDRGSRPVVGSSTHRTRGRPTRLAGPELTCPTPSSVLPRQHPRATNLPAVPRCRRMKKLRLLQAGTLRPPGTHRGRVGHAPDGPPPPAGRYPTHTMYLAACRVK